MTNQKKEQNVVCVHQKADLSANNKSCGHKQTGAVYLNYGSERSESIFLYVTSAAVDFPDKGIHGATARSMGV